MEQAKIKVRLSISDEGGMLITRYYIKEIKNLRHVMDLLQVPLNLPQKLVLVDAIQMEKDKRYIRGMYEYNNLVASYGVFKEEFDLLIVNKETMPAADYHFQIGITKQKLQLIIFKLENRGGRVMYQGKFREFNPKNLENEGDYK